LESREILIDIGAPPGYHPLIVFTLFLLVRTETRETLMSFRLGAMAVLLVMFLLAGCGGPAARVTGHVTCQGKPVKGSILFSPKGEDASNKGPGVAALIKEDGTYEVRLTAIGKHTVVITPSEIKYPLKPGEVDFPCDRSPSEWDVKAGDNKIVIEMSREP
jgi:hypothetical protein